MQYFTINEKNSSSKCPSQEGRAILINYRFVFCIVYAIPSNSNITCTGTVLV